MLATVRDIGEADGTIGFFSFIPRYVVERSIDILSDKSEAPVQQIQETEETANEKYCTSCFRPLSPRRHLSPSLR
jgi:hypothetical protein